MNISESIQYQALINSGKCYPKRLEEINQELPYFEIYKNNHNRRDIRFFNYEKEDNAARAPYIADYLKKNILPNVDRDYNINGFYNIELHDSYTYRDKYLVEDTDYTNVLTFAKFKGEKGPVLIPDIYQLGNYGNTLQFEDKLGLDKKTPQVIFRGGTTGIRNPEENKRIDMCKWALGKPLLDFKITNVVQMNATLDPSIMGQPMSINDQLNYRYIFSMDGNTSKFDIWPYKTNSVVLKYESTEMLWYYPLMMDKFHYLDVTKDTLENTVNHINNNLVEGQIININARRFVHEILKPISPQIYTVALFDGIGENA